MRDAHPFWRLVWLIVVLFALWQGFELWTGYRQESTISATGTATLRAAPDHFVFSPNYLENGTTSEEAVSAVSKIGNEVVAKLKQLGVADGDIATSVSSHFQNWDNPAYGPIPAKIPDYKEGYVGSYVITVTSTTVDQARTIFNYLTTTTAHTGSLTPTADFTPAKRTKLEKEARTQALTDARATAEQTAESLGAKILGVKSVTEQNPFIGPIGYADGMGLEAVGDSISATTPTFQVGDQDFSFSVSIDYRIR